MRKKTGILILCLLCWLGVAGQEAVTWEKLATIKWVPTFIPSLGDFYDFPRFSKEIKKLNGKTISIKGFYVPVDISGKIFALSAQPSQMCFFCNGGGPESVMEIITKEGTNLLKGVKADKFIEVKGKLRLNETDINHLMYILEEAELIEIIK